MATSRIKEKISALVSSQLPEFVQSDFTTFVAFIEAYYRFLEQDQGASELIQNARSYNDIDRTTDSFVQYFLQTYAKNTPQGLLTNERFLVKRIRDLYEAKGSELSFKLLFRTLFNTDVDVRVPYENVLRASGGIWQQNFSIRVETLTGDRNDLADRIISHSAGGVLFQTPIVRTKILSTTQTELFLESSLLSSSYTVGDLVEVYEGSTLVFSGTITATTVSYSVPQPGSGFKVGQIFTINFGGGVGTIVKVTGISSGGGITKLKILNYGYGYTSDSGFISVTLDPTKSISEEVSFLLSKTQGFGSSGAILLNDPTSPNRYFDTDYCDLSYTFTSQVGSFNNDVFNPAATVEQTIPANLAIVRFNLGALAAYPGSYSSDQSFISEFEVRLQDDQLYQPFAYQTVTDVDIADFVDVVKKLLNPAGQTLFNNRTLSANIDLSAQLVVTPISNIFFEAYDSFDVSDPNSLDISKPFTELQVIDDGIFNLNTQKLEQDNVEITENEVYNLAKQIDDSVSMTDVVLIGGIFGVSIDDTANVGEAYASSFTKSINNNETTVNLTETGELRIQDYFLESYVSETYTGSTFNII